MHKNTSVRSLTDDIPSAFIQNCATLDGQASAKPGRLHTSVKIPDSVIAAAKIILCTLNAKYIHASLGLRYLLANMGDLKACTVLREFTIARPAQEIVDALLAELPETPNTPSIIGFGVYIWNTQQTLAVIRLLKSARPQIKIILGGPEVSYETNEQEITGLADHVITGWGDLSFTKLCHALVHGPRPLNKVIAGEQVSLEQIVLPYQEYSATDLAHRLLYVEASRGCPFKCEFCLSALDKTAWAFNLDHFLAEMASLYERGARHFKFVDRTFNLKVDTSLRILQFFLDRLDGPGEALFLHFELVPDHLPDALKAMIARFPPGVLQFEVGIQTFNPAVQQAISRRQDNEKSEENLRWLLEQSHAHIHADLIFGLPGEMLDSFAAGFDRLYALQPHEIQLGILKRLRGTPIIRHSIDCAMVYDQNAPYQIVSTGCVDAIEVEAFNRFSRYWDMLANTGRFQQSLPRLLQTRTSPFQAFWAFSQWLWQQTSKTNGLSPEMLIDALFNYLVEHESLPAETVRQVLLSDYVASGARSNPQALAGFLPKRQAPLPRGRSLAQRQDQHRAGSEQ